MAVVMRRPVVSASHATSIDGRFLLISPMIRGTCGVMRNDGAKRDQPGGGANSAGWTTAMFDDEEEHGKRLLWRLGTWGVATTLAIATAAWISHTSTGLRRERLAYAEISMQARQLQAVSKNAQDEAKRLSTAVDVLNTDRDRLYSRVTSIEQGLDSVTGSIAKREKRESSSSWPAATAEPVLSSPPLISGVATSIAALQQETARHEASHKESDPAKPAETVPAEHTAKPEQTATLPVSQPGDPVSAQPSVPAPPAPGLAAVQRTDFALDLGSANSIEGLRALWRGSLKGWPALVGSLTPLIAVREGHDGLGLRLHLVAGPIADAAAAAKLCASLVANRHGCETTVFDGQLLAVRAAPPAAPVPAREKSRRKSRAQAEKPVEEPPRQPPPQQQPPPPQQSSGGLMSVFGSR